MLRIFLGASAGNREAKSRVVEIIAARAFLRRHGQADFILISSGIASASHEFAQATKMLGEPEDMPS